jgi:uncharacterized membrane protein
MKIIILLTYLISFLPVILFTAFTPYLTRRSESFGIGITEELYDAPAVKRIRTIYRNRVLWSGLILTVVILVIALNTLLTKGTALIGAGTSLQVLLMFIFYLQGRRSMKVLKALHHWETAQPQVVVIDTDFRKRKVLVSPWWFVGDFSLIALTVFLGFTLYPQLPERIPSHLNMLGQVDCWMAKSYSALLIAPAMQLLMTLLLIFVYRIIGKAKQQTDTSYPEQSMEQNRIFRYRWSAYIVFTSLVMNILFGITLFAGLINHVAIFIISSGTLGVVMIWVIILSVTMGQGGSRLSIGKSKIRPAGNRDEDRFWKFGIFYYNPDDAALFVEKRFGIGWTCNFARPVAWVLLIGLICFIILMTKIPTIFSK